MLKTCFRESSAWWKYTRKGNRWVNSWEIRKTQPDAIFEMILHWNITDRSYQKSNQKEQKPSSWRTNMFEEIHATLHRHEWQEFEQNCPRHYSKYRISVTVSSRLFLVSCHSLFKSLSCSQFSAGLFVCTFQPMNTQLKYLHLSELLVTETQVVSLTLF